MEAISNTVASGSKYLILGGGSNILFTEDFKGTILKNNLKGIEILSENDSNVWIRARSGEIWHELVLYCVERGWAGIENLALIPGTAGAAPIQNIGAYGVEIQSVLEEVEALDIAGETIKTIGNSDCRFGYRDSIFKQEAKGKFFITGIVLKLSKKPVLQTSYGDIQEVLRTRHITQPQIGDVCQAVITIRKQKLPDPSAMGNAGSFFKNPVIPQDRFEQLRSRHPDLRYFPVDAQHVKIPAAWLIEQCGWKGYRDGDAGVHRNQALVLINYGSATGKQIVTLAQKIIHSVEETFGIELTPEVNIL